MKLKQFRSGAYDFSFDYPFSWFPRGPRQQQAGFMWTFRGDFPFNLVVGRMSGNIPLEDRKDPLQALARRLLGGGTIIQEGFTQLRSYASSEVLVYTFVRKEPNGDIIKKTAVHTSRMEYVFTANLSRTARFREIRDWRANEQVFDNAVATLKLNPHFRLGPSLDPSDLSPRERLVGSGLMLYTPANVTPDPYYPSLLERVSEPLAAILYFIFALGSVGLAIYLWSVRGFWSALLYFAIIAIVSGLIRQGLEENKLGLGPTPIAKVTLGVFEIVLSAVLGFLVLNWGGR